MNKRQTDYQHQFQRLVYLKKNPAQDLPTLDAEELAELQSAFDLFDAEGNGRIQPSELVRIFKKLRLDSERPSMYKMAVSLNTAENNEEGVTFEQFIEGVMNYYGDRYTEEGVRHIFELFDEDGDGVITRDAFRKLAQELGVSIDRREIEDIFTKASSDERVISYKDFEIFMRRDIGEQNAAAAGRR
ncbi:hypothetical protein FGO68_gene4347 [Halteria grandinella]|uniref:EF-hand domain-containing protein n=1 Tax=Halteria grandinella TaxID=5974 RepID=A0A8J8SYN4_HALGN|nr:hypothetical protein FGO68_gene4347 [Halteria grandinella]